MAKVRKASSTPKGTRKSPGTPKAATAASARRSPGTPKAAASVPSSPDAPSPGQRSEESPVGMTDTLSDPEPQPATCKADMASADGERAEGAEGSEPSTRRYFRVEGHLHLGLNLTLRKVYSESDLERRCKGDKTKLDRLQGMMSGEGDLLREVAPPPKPQSSGGKRKQDELTPPDRPLEEKEREKLKRRAMSRRICLGQLVWDCSQRPPRAAKVTAIAAERQEPFLIRHLDAPKGPSRSSFKVGDEVMVHDRVGICIWDGRPEHQYARVRWDDDGSESEILPVSQITAENRCLEEVFVSDADLAPLDLSHLLHAASKKAGTGLGEDKDIVDPLAELCGPVAIPPPRELMVRSSDTREKLAVGQVAWCHQKCRLPWPAQLLSFTEGEGSGSAPTRETCHVEKHGSSS
ncbi:unnamed protein product [Cladocopium goreaui]|uniref:Uncharacterized protein n=1 Tax=Cladocopium goreaui TaxID=2562237 RepID=A0A9P1BHG4_9DINO|nr:unnamed protein product [Cladocopium goreaui]